MKQLKHGDMSNIFRSIKRIPYTTNNTQELMEDVKSDSKYRIIEPIIGGFYVQQLVHTTTINGCLWWKKSIVNFKWISLSKYGTTTINTILYVYGNEPKKFNTLVKAKEFMQRVLVGDVVHVEY